jgi:hypothetical protein
VLSFIMTPILTQKSLSPKKTGLLAADASDFKAYFKASDLQRITYELVAIANTVPVGMPALGERPSDPTRNWQEERARVLASTKSFSYFPLVDIAAEVVGSAKGWRRGEAAEFARKVAEAIRFVARYDWLGPVPPKRWNYPLIEMYETRIEPQYNTGHVLVRKNRLIDLYATFRLWLEQIDGTRLRECPVCRKLYYARRLDQSACSTSCAHRLRSRRWYAMRGKKQRRISGTEKKR